MKKVWSTRTFERLYSIYSHHDVGDIFAVVYSSSLKTVYCGGQNTSIQVFSCLAATTTTYVSNSLSGVILQIQVLLSTRHHRRTRLNGPIDSSTPEAQTADALHAQILALTLSTLAPKTTVKY